MELDETDVPSLPISKEKLPSVSVVGLQQKQSKPKYLWHVQGFGELSSYVFLCAQIINGETGQDICAFSFKSKSFLLHLNLDFNKNCQNQFVVLLETRPSALGMSDPVMESLEILGTPEFSNLWRVEGYEGENDEKVVKKDEKQWKIMKKW